MDEQVERAVQAAIRELERQADQSGCTTATDGTFVQVDGSFEIRPLVQAVLGAQLESS